MDLILHLGAHRGATTSFQHYLRANTGALIAGGTGFWGPGRTRGGLLDGLGAAPVTPAEVRAANRAAGRVRVNVARSRIAGVRRLLVSDENMLGTPARCLRAARLYPDAGHRMARIGAGFGTVTRVVLTIRRQDTWWESVLAHLVARGFPVPDAARLERIAADARGWRDVVTDLACALPGAEIVVTPFEAVAGRPQVLFAAATGQAGPGAARDCRRNASLDADALRARIRARGETTEALPEGDGRWHPFTPSQTARLREAWADDMHWLIAGAEGLARLVEREDAGRTGARETTTGQMEERPLPLWQTVTGPRGRRHGTEGRLG